ncbi:CDP-glycerol glycerophosphotransferase family protein [Salinibacterium sp. G-O1]|uniref:CDP-glycerol glycerophosphotransferase family protein n=1 Tax=Salinibacterium sp. G-O1 TaxID=3046208 RepID=UPI0024B9B066|nr:CDP-glycerol glycerophosphotransferase family protein [Salinibacterium sp. G-O1]MDJ0334534.1 CDP-glycerol glycerophosphotransferase family protein [Salinibacterium sp. G-O1]
MPLGRDIRTARRLTKRILESRRDRAQVSRLVKLHPQPAPGSVQIAVYFADAKVNMYQVRQWFAPLAEIAETWPVAIIARAPSAALALWEESPVPTYYLRSVADLETFVHNQQIRIVFYVNQNTRNFQMFRYGRMWHVFINHGESDKMYMSTNQFKAYDYSFVAGEAALDRLGHKLWDFDLEKRAIPIGRPQADHLGGELPFTPDDRTVVLYAPTWEGDRSAAAYGSIASHGVDLATALLATGEHRVIYRPHPRSGVVDHDYKAANHAIIAAIAKANAADPGAQHVFDDSPQLGWQLGAADVAITDISAMVYDRLATGRPLLVTRPISAAAEIDESGYLGAAEWLNSADAADVVAFVERVQVDEEAHRRLHYWVERHFGDTTPGVATQRFRTAISTLMTEWETHSAIHAEDDDEDDDEFDPFDDLAVGSPDAS